MASGGGGGGGGVGWREPGTSSSRTGRSIRLVTARERELDRERSRPANLSASLKSGYRNVIEHICYDSHTLCIGSTRFKNGGREVWQTACTF